jgi:NADH:ubiquinone oxidoreductase subunit 5 (subunit L)/multisubunit Na+/H+ antiporter MnhA subunit
VLSAHAGVVLLSATMDLWFLPLPRVLLAAVGLTTAVIGTLVGKVRADRKGSIANVSAATVGLLYVILAAGFPDVALVLCFGHAAFRMVQVLRAHNLILDTHNVKSCIGHNSVGPTQVPAWLFRLSWKLMRINSDLRLPHFLHRFIGGKPLGLGKFQMSLVSCALVALTVVPYLRHSHVESLVHSQPCVAALILVLTVMISTDLMHFVFVDVLDPRRFRYDSAAQAPTKVAGKSQDGSLAEPLLAAQPSSASLCSVASEPSSPPRGPKAAGAA